MAKPLRAIRASEEGSGTTMSTVNVSMRKLEVAKSPEVAAKVTSVPAGIVSPTRPSRSSMKESSPIASSWETPSIKTSKPSVGWMDSNSISVKMIFWSKAMTMLTIQLH